VERYNGPEHRWVIAKVKLSTLINVKDLIPKLNLFIAFTGNLDFKSDNL